MALLGPPRLWAQPRPDREHQVHLDLPIPLRVVHLVRWKHPEFARDLRSVGEVRAAEAKGEVTIERTGVVVNMPMLTWPGGRR